jgi:hypothetical protein
MTPDEVAQWTAAIDTEKKAPETVEAEKIDAETG